MSSPRQLLQSFGPVVITGGSSGIGKSFIELLGNLNPKLVFFNLSRHQPGPTSNPRSLCHLPCDLGQPAELEWVGERLSGLLREQAPAGRLLLINNSGFGLYGRSAEIARRRQLEMIDVKVRAVVGLTSLLLPELQKRGGAIINVASTAAFQPTPFLAAYGATKTFVLHWSLALRQELKPWGVPVLALCPGPTATAFFREAGFAQSMADGWLGLQPEQVVRTALRALAAGRSLAVPGWTNRALATLSSLTPKSVAAAASARILGRTRLRQVPST